MRVLVSPDKFKGCLTAAEAAEAIARGLRAAGADVMLAPIADGGEGTLEALVAAVGGSVMGTIARGPLGIPVRAHVGILSDGTAVVEMSQASGLRLVAERDRDPMKASSFGTGEMIRAAIARRAQRILIAIGGSATVDGGMGLARALGIRFLDAGGSEVAEGGQGLEHVARIDDSTLDKRLPGTPLVVASDVMAPLLGPEGAAHAFGPQKGATREQVDGLERGLANLAERLRDDLGADVAERPGAGAAGGVGAMLMALGAEMRSGAELVLEAVGFRERLKEADLVVTGEGRLDMTTAQGKAPAMVARMAREAGVPCVALVGSAADVPAEFEDVRTLLEYFAGDREEAMRRAADGLKALGARLGSKRR